MEEKNYIKFKKKSDILILIIGKIGLNLIFPILWNDQLYAMQACYSSIYLSCYPSILTKNSILDMSKADRPTWGIDTTPNQKVHIN